MRLLILTLIVQALLLSCQTPNSQSKVPLTITLDQGPRVDEAVRANQDQWLQGLVLDPDQTGITTLVVLGDSFSDTGRLFQKTRSLGPPQIYWRSRFSNGPIWVDYVQSATAWKIQNYAFSDLNDGDRSQTIPMTSMSRQLERLHKETQAMKRESMLVSLWFGPDFYQQQSQLSAVKTLMHEIRKTLVELNGLGFHHIALGNMPDLALHPLARAPQVSSSQLKFWQQVSAEHNAALKDLIDDLKRAYRDMQPFTFQVMEMQKTSREKAASAGIHLQQEACYQGNVQGVSDEPRKFCRNPDSTQYWDAVHPSSKLHCFFAAQFLADTLDAEHIGGYNRPQAVDHCQQL